MIIMFHKTLTKRTALFAAVLLLLSSLALPCFAWSTEDYADILTTGQGIRFSAVCRTADDVAQAAQVGADYYNIAPTLPLQDALAAVESAKAAISEKALTGATEGKHLDALLKKIQNAKFLIDVTTAAEADAVYEAAKEENALDKLCLRFRTKAKVAEAWLSDKDPAVDVIGFYTGNVIFSAILRTKKYAAIEQTQYMQLQTKNPYGVILHRTYVQSFINFNINGMFSFRDPAISAGRVDCSQSWDDLIARGYTVIETAYPQDFAEYLAANMAERQKLLACVAAAKKETTENCPSNRVKEYNKALARAQALLEKGNASSEDMTHARVRLDSAVQNLTVKGGKIVQGDYAFTVARVCAAVFGIALVVCLQIFFRSRWAKKQKKESKNEDNTSTP